MRHDPSTQLRRTEEKEAEYGAKTPLPSAKPDPMTSRRRKSRRYAPFALLIAFGVSLVVAIALGTATLVFKSYQRALENTAREIGNLSLVLTSQIDRALQGVKAVQAGIAD